MGRCVLLRNILPHQIRRAGEDRRVSDRTSVTEDYLVTLKLSEIGMKTIYLNERLSLGLAPEGLKEYITQRSRWCLGLVQICRGSDGPFSKSNKMPLIYRLSLIRSLLVLVGWLRVSYRQPAYPDALSFVRYSRGTGRLCRCNQ